LINATFLSLSIFIAIMTVYAIVYGIYKKKKQPATSRLIREYENIDDSVKKQKTGFLNNLEKDLLSAQLNIDARAFVIIILVLSVVLYIGAYYIFEQPFVSFAPLPFSLFFLPRAFIEYKKNKEEDKFDAELIQILRRMSSTLKNGSVLQALEDVKDLPSLSEKSRILLNEIFHRYKYGESIESAFYKVAENSGSEQFMLCARSIDINKELGADLSESVNKIALNIQRQRLTEKEGKSLMSQTVMIGRTLSVAPFLIIGYMMLQNKDYFSGYLETFGHQLIFVGLFMVMFFGIYIVDKMSRTL